MGGSRSRVDDGVGASPDATAGCVRSAAQARHTGSVPKALDVDADSFRYPDGARDTEALVVDPRNAALDVISRSLNGLGEVFRATPVEVTSASQPQGDDMTYTADGRGYLLAGEGVGSARYRVDCASAGGDSPAPGPAGAVPDDGASRSVNG